MKIREKLLDQPVGSLRLLEFARVQVGASLPEVVDFMREERRAFVLICSGDEIAGIFTERDMLMRAFSAKGLLAGPIASFMTCDPVTLDSSARLADAFGAMVAGSFRHLPVIDDLGKCIGVLDIYGVLGFLAESFPDRILNIPPRPHRVLQDRHGA